MNKFLITLNKRRYDMKFLPYFIILFIIFMGALAYGESSYSIQHAPKDKEAPWHLRLPHIDWPIVRFATQGEAEKYLSEYNKTGYNILDVNNSLHMNKQSKKKVYEIIRNFYGEFSLFRNNDWLGSYETLGMAQNALKDFEAWDVIISETVPIDTPEEGLKTLGYDEKHNLWHKIRVDEQGRVICSP